MTRRRLERPSSSGGAPGDGKPSLEAVLDHYGVDYNSSRVRQMIRCPLHEDNTPSFSLDTDKQVWNCHSCGNGGDSWRLIEKREETDFDGARAYAAAQSITAGDAGGGGGSLRAGAGRYGRSRKVPARSRDRGGDGGYVPSWRRK